jgi:DNA-binding NarL/FixJ family response regulator
MSGLRREKVQQRKFQKLPNIVPIRIPVDADVGEIEIPIRLVLVVSFYKTRKLIEVRETNDGEEIPNLTKRENEVLSGILRSQSNKEIASALSVSERTVKFHVSSLLRIFGVRGRASLRDRIFGKAVS